MATKFITIMRYLGEFSGSALLVALTCLGCADGSEMPKLQYGLVVMIIIHCFGFVSGGHANPCITLACYMMRYISMKMAMIYMAAQFLGALTGFFLLTAMLPSDAISNDLCLMKPNGSLSWDQTFVIESVLTTTLIFGWCALWDARNSSYLDSVSLRIGFLVAACTLAGVSTEEFIIFTYVDVRHILFIYIGSMDWCLYESRNCTNTRSIPSETRRYGPLLGQSVFVGPFGTCTMEAVIFLAQLLQ
ncbi:unnamed protein product [Ceratitis capitata]|uniref:(Mediterranean fruit fly) hypothetical protein n=1 Tax=Ceratitis capitata TaxID=7213 RepID=A0A811VDP1_CERCA|nr:unnamed protein product [Ceratitis capitata]